MASCSSEYGGSHKLPIKSVDGLVNLAEVVDGEWDRVCIFSPYSTNQVAEDVLGFKWPLETESGVGVNDGVSLLVFVKSSSVASFYEIPRNTTDFTNLGGACYGREDSVFKVDSNGWPVASRA